MANVIPFTSKSANLDVRCGKIGIMSARERAFEVLSDGAPKTASELARLGVDRKTLRRMASKGEVASDARGVYQLSEAALDQHAPLSSLMLAVPGSVACLYTAAGFHGMTVHRSMRMWIAVPHGRRALNLPANAQILHWRRPGALKVGVVEVKAGGGVVRVTDPARTLVDMFRYSPLSGYANQLVDEEAFLDVLKGYAESGAGAAAPSAYAQALGCHDRMAPFLKMLTALPASDPPRRFGP